MTNELKTALENFFGLPNWENRIGPWKDLNEAAKGLHTAFQREKLLDPQNDVMGELRQWVDQYRDNIALGEHAAVEGMEYLLKAWERHGLSRKMGGVNELGGAKNCVHRMIEVLQAFEGKLAIMEQMAIDALEKTDGCLDAN